MSKTVSKVAVMKERQEDVKKIFAKHFSERIIDISPCGNHELKRNLVYKVVLENSHYIIKFYYKPNKRVREINAVPIIEEFNELKIVNYGITDDGIEWMIYNFLDGWLLDQIYDDLDLDQLRYIFYEIGKRTAKLHNIATFDYFGDVQKDKQSLLSQYHTFVVDDCERLIDNLHKQNLHEIDTISNSIEKLRNEFVNIRELKFGRYTHRDLDGRNILIKISPEKGMQLNGFLDFEKTVINNEYMDIIGFYRRYFLKEPKLIAHFFKGYEEVLPVDDTFNLELRFNLYKTGIDICSWSLDVSKNYFESTLAYLKELERIDPLLEELYYKK